MAHNPSAQLIFATELPAPCSGRFGYAAYRFVRPGESSLLQLSTRFERLNAAFLALDLGIGTAEKKGNVWPNLIPEGSLSSSQRGLGNEFVVLQGVSGRGVVSTTMYSVFNWQLSDRERSTYSDCLEDAHEAREVRDATVNRLHGGLEEFERVAQGIDAVGIRGCAARRARPGSHGSPEFTMPRSRKKLKERRKGPKFEPKPNPWPGLARECGVLGAAFGGEMPEVSCFFLVLSRGVLVRLFGCGVFSRLF